jgi:hypothetical protein
MEKNAERKIDRAATVIHLQSEIYSRAWTLVEDVLCASTRVEVRRSSAARLGETLNKLNAVLGIKERMEFPPQPNVGQCDRCGETHHCGGAK